MGCRILLTFCGICRACRLICITRSHARQSRDVRMDCVAVCIEIDRGGELRNSRAMPNRLSAFVCHPAYLAAWPFPSHLNSAHLILLHFSLSVNHAR